jgi:hypothetical protein
LLCNALDLFKHDATLGGDMGKKNKAHRKSMKKQDGHGGAMGQTKIVEEPSKLKNHAVIFKMFDEEEDTDPGIEDCETPIEQKPVIQVNINVPKKSTEGAAYPSENPLFCKLAEDFLVKFDVMTRAYLSWKHKDFDRALMGYKLDLTNKLYALQWVAKEMRDLLPRVLHTNMGGSVELIPNPHYEKLYQMLMPCDNEGILAINPDERDDALFRMEQERDTLKNMLRGLKR